MQRYVAGFMFNPSMDHLALVRKKRPPWQEGRLNAIGGEIAEGEEPLEAMVREFQEETGVFHTEWEPTVILHKENVFEVHFFRAFSKRVYEVRTIEDEAIELHPLTHLNAGPSFRTIPNLSWLVPMQLDLHLDFPVTLSER